MLLSEIGPTSGNWSKIENGKRWKASYRVDWWRSLEEYNTPFVSVIHHRCEQGAEQQTMLVPCVTREEAVWAVEQFLAAMGYRQEAVL